MRNDMTKSTHGMAIRDMSALERTTLIYARATLELTIQNYFRSLEQTSRTTLNKDYATRDYIRQG